MNIFVGNLSFEAKEEDVLKVFSAFGTVASVAIVMEKKGKKSRGFGFVEMADETEALAAIAGLNNQEVLGRPINVMASLPKEPRQPGEEDSPKKLPNAASRRGSYDRKKKQEYATPDLTYRGTGRFKEGRRSINFMKKRVESGLTATTPERKFKANPLRWKKKSRWTDSAAQREAKPWQKSDGEAKPWQKPEGAAKPWQKPEGEARPWQKREGAAKPWQKSEGAARPWSKPEGAARTWRKPEGDRAKPWQKREGASSGPWQKPEGAAKPWQRSESSARPWRKPEGGTAKPWQKREGTSRPWQKSEGAAKPWQKREGAAKPWSKPDGAVKPWRKPEGAAARPWRKSSSDRAPSRVRRTRE